tara:strand:+ start:157 stop:375 length:219 start_codon:yes stop_codon:yes gene_type:complete
LDEKFLFFGIYYHSLLGFWEKQVNIKPLLVSIYKVVHYARCEKKHFALKLILIPTEAKIYTWEILNETYTFN